MENYGFKLLARDEAQQLGLPESTGMFSDLFQQMEEEVKRNRFKKNEYGTALSMTPHEKTISFLNRYFVYKKVRNVNAEKVSLELLEDIENIQELAEKGKKNLIIVEPTLLEKPKVKKLKKKIILEQEQEKEQEKEQEQQVKQKQEKKPRAKKMKLVLE
jgi:hypothetical protein